MNKKTENRTCSISPKPDMEDSMSCLALGISLHGSNDGAWPFFNLSFSHKFRMYCLIFRFCKGCIMFLRPNFTFVFSTKTWVFFLAHKFCGRSVIGECISGFLLTMVFTEMFYTPLILQMRPQWLQSKLESGRIFEKPYFSCIELRVLQLSQLILDFRVYTRDF